MTKWKVRAHRDVMKKDLPLLEQNQLKDDFDDIVTSLKKNPYNSFRHFEKLNPHHLEIYSLQLNHQHRVVFTIQKKEKIVKIWSAWSHYENRMPHH